MSNARSVLRFKVLDPGGRCRNGGHGEWHLPRGSRPGKWMPKVKPELCESGYHVCTPLQLLQWLGPEIWIVEVRGEHQNSSDKSCWEQARIIAPTQWNERNARLFAADCAEHALPIFENLRPGDDRPRLCIAAARDFAWGRIDRSRLAAARAAAWAAAWAAAGAAAGAAARAAAWAAAWAAAGAAAGAAARAAAGAAAGAAARSWQARLLRSYLTGRKGRR